MADGDRVMVVDFGSLTTKYGVATSDATVDPAELPSVTFSVAGRLGCVTTGVHMPA